MIALRPASLDDCAQVWAWRFAADVRAVSADARLVELDEHAAWYHARLLEPASPIWIVEDAGAGIGVVRVDQMADGSGMMSIALARAARGRGAGRGAIAASCQRWNKRVVAIIRADNTASQAAFEACGFRPAARTAPPFGGSQDLITYVWSPDGES